LDYKRALNRGITDSCKEEKYAKIRDFMGQEIID